MWHRVCPNPLEATPAPFTPCTAPGGTLGWAPASPPAGAAPEWEGRVSQSHAKRASNNSFVCKNTLPLWPPTGQRTKGSWASAVTLWLCQLRNLQGRRGNFHSPLRGRWAGLGQPALPGVRPPVGGHPSSLVHLERSITEVKEMNKIDSIKQSV